MIKPESFAYRLRSAIIMALAAGSLAACQAETADQSAGALPEGMTPEMLAEMRAAQERNFLMPDTPGTGQFPAMKEEDPSLPDHVVYRPADLSAVGAKGLGIVAWGNGGCSDDGAGVRQHLAELASHGYLVIASGTIQSGPEFPLPEESGPPPIGPDGERILPPALTTPAQLTEAIDWAAAQNADPDSPYYGKLDTDAVAVSGWSCGGLQAITVGTSDPRVKTLLIHNSGIFDEPMPGRETQPEKAVLAQLRGPILYVLGGPEDIAYANGTDDFARISSVPAALADLPVGHGGTFYEPNGGAAAQVAVAWLNWQLKGDEEAAKMFNGDDCGLCTDADWTLQRKGF